MLAWWTLFMHLLLSDMRARFYPKWWYNLHALYPQLASMPAGPFRIWQHNSVVYRRRNRYKNLLNIDVSVVVLIIVDIRQHLSQDYATLSAYDMHAVVFTSLDCTNVWSYFNCQPAMPQLRKWFKEPHMSVVTHTKLWKLLVLVWQLG